MPRRTASVPLVPAGSPGCSPTGCSATDIQNLGNDLWTLLLGGPIEKEFDRARRLCRERAEAVLKIRLGVPPEFEDLPWEAMYDFDELSLATSPKVAMVRWPAAQGIPPPGRSMESVPLKMLVVIPSGSGLGTSVEWERIRQSVLAAWEQVKLEPLDGPVTTERLAQTLRGRWDIVHFIGRPPSASKPAGGSRSSSYRQGEAETSLSRLKSSRD